jgi:hypothetical protein
MSELLKINVNDHVEKKNGLTYLSWAWAWAEVLKIDPAARWTAHEWDGVPVCYLRNGTAMVKVSVEIKGDIKTCLLPVIDHRNKPIVDPDAFQVNTATMRCLVKCIAMHGLGLYIYAGEDLPEGEEPPAPAVNPEIVAKIAEINQVKALRAYFKNLSDEERRLHIDLIKARAAELEAA